ncbi:hypothetical protein II810_02625 [bacterium]|nr:hypothetical protein [bacterium]
MPVTVNEVIRRLSQGFNQVFDDYKGLYLFGISSDGEIHEDEDIELAAIFDIDDQSKRKQIWPIIGKVETEMDVCIDLYPFTEETLKEDEEIYEQVKQTGIFYNKKGMKE